MYRTLNPKSDVDRVYLSREMEGRGLISCKVCIRNSVEQMIEGMKAVQTMEYNDTVNKKEFTQMWMRVKKGLWKSKRMYGQFVREMLEITDEKETWNWLRKADLKVETKVMLCAAQE